MSVVRIAVVGAGNWGRNHVRTLASMPGLELAAVCDTDDDRRAELSRQYPGVRITESLDEALITVGSHTSTHPILPTLTPEEAREEIEGSRSLLEERLRRPVRYFCTPNGCHDDAIVDCVKRYYDAAVIDAHGVVREDSDPGTGGVQRIAVAGDDACGGSIF